MQDDGHLRQIAAERSARATNYLVLITKQLFTTFLVMLVLTCLFTLLSIFFYNATPLD
jgi:hypothetical protein